MLKLSKVSTFKWACLLSSAWLLSGCGGGGGGGVASSSSANLDATSTAAVTPGLALAGTIPISVPATAAIPLPVITTSGPIPSTSPCAPSAVLTFCVTATPEQFIPSTSSAGSAIAFDVEITDNSSSVGNSFIVLTPEDPALIPTGATATILLGFAGSGGVIFGTSIVLNDVAFDSASGTFSFEVADLEENDFFDALTQGQIAFTIEAEGLAIRGQIVPDGIQVIQVALEPGQVVPPNPGVTPASSANGTPLTGGSGLAFFTFEDGSFGTNILGTTGPEAVVNVTTSFDATEVNVVIGSPAGLNSSNVQISVPAIGASSTSFSTVGPAPAASEIGIGDGNYFIEAVDSTGASVRGQVIPETVQVLQIDLLADQVIPGTAGTVTIGAAGTGTATAFMTLDLISSGNALADTSPSVVVRAGTGFVLDQAIVNAGGGFAGLLGGANPIVLGGDPADGFLTANTPLDSSTQTIANATVLLQGGYNIQAIDASANALRGQILPAGIEAVVVDLEPDQVVPPLVAAAAGSTATGFFTFDSTNGIIGDGNPNANNPVVVVRTDTSFTPATVQVIAGGGFAGLNGSAVIDLNNDVESDVFTANVPTGVGPFAIGSDAELQSIAALPALSSGGYHLKADNAADESIRGQIAPDGIQVIQTTLEAPQVVGGPAISGGVTGTAFMTLDTTNSIGGNVVGDDTANNPVVVASFDAASAPTEVQVIAGMAFAGTNGTALGVIDLVESTTLPGTFLANVPVGALAAESGDLQSIASLGGLLAGAYFLQASESTAADAATLRGQLVPAGITVNAAALNAGTTQVGTGFVTENASASTLVANAAFTSSIPPGIELVDGSAATVLTLAEDTDPASLAGSGLFTSGGPQVVDSALLGSGELSFTTF